MAAKIVFTFKDDAKDELQARSKRLVRTGAPFKLAGTTLSVQFLRGVFSRASLCVPAYYYFLGSASARDIAKSSSDYPFKIAQSQLDAARAVGQVGKGELAHAADAADEPPRQGKLHFWLDSS